jgi:hypothetical protein
MRPGHAAASPINPKPLVSSSMRTLCRNARFSPCLPSRIVTVAEKPKPLSIDVSAINAVAACTLALTYEWQRGRSQQYSPLLWKVYMPAIGKVRPALRSMGTTVADFIE